MDPYQALMRQMQRQAKAFGPEQSQIMIVTAVNTTNHTCLLRRPHEPAGSSNGLHYPYPAATAPTVGQRVRVWHYPEGDAIRDLL